MGIEICGIPLAKGTVGEIRRRVGLLFQDPDDQLFMPRVADDVAFGPWNLGLGEEEVQRRVREELRAVGMEDFAERPPHRLSMGEKKRVALATVLSMRPEILALDEPTGGLDPRGRREFVELVRGLDVTVVVATHDRELVLSLCDRAVLLHGGRVIAEGPAAEILAAPDLMCPHP